VVLKGKASIDYSFVTGESDPVEVKEKEIVYAGGRQKGDELTIRVVKPVAGSYLTSLWNHYAFNKSKAEKNDRESVIHVLSKYFTIVLFGLAAITAAYWYVTDPSKIIGSVSAMLIVACPCALLLSVTFTNGNFIRIFSNNGFFLRDASVIEQLGNIDKIVFDKTGTITQNNNTQITVQGNVLTAEDKDLLYAVVSRSKHPYSKSIAQWLGVRNGVKLDEWTEHHGKGIEASFGSRFIKLGSADFVLSTSAEAGKAAVYVQINDSVSSFHIQSAFRQNVPAMVDTLRQQYDLALLSGDNDRQKPLFADLFGNKSDLLFEQKPMDKLQYIESLQNKGKRVMMIGDGLNDAGALQQSNVGVTLADDINNFTPSCDAILDASRFTKLPEFLALSRSAAKIINASFIISILYNLVGLYFAMQGLLRPVSAAILMPCSTLSIVIITSGVSSFVAWRKGMKVTGIKN
jgi:Cu+-exporting ATPase